MDISGKLDHFFYDKEEREAAKKVHLMQLRSAYNNAGEDSIKAAKRTAESYLELKKTAGSDAALQKLVESVEKTMVCPF